MFRKVIAAYAGEEEEADWVWGSSARAASMTRKEIRRVAGDALDNLGLPAGTPVRAVFGDRDIYGPFARRFAERLEDVDTTFLPDCGHLPWLDAPEPFAAWLREGLEAGGFSLPAGKA